MVCVNLSPFYPINQSKYCIIALLMNDRVNIKRRCTIRVKPNEVLPQAKQVSSGVWAVSVAKRLKFTINCDTGDVKEEIVDPPLKIIHQIPGCEYNSNYINFAAHYEFESVVKINDNVKKMQRRLTNYTFSIWEPFDQAIQTFNKTWNVENLKDIEDIKMEKLVKELNEVKRIDILKRESMPLWSRIVGGIVILIIVGIVIYLTVPRNAIGWIRNKFNRTIEATTVPTAPSKEEELEMVPLKIENNNKESSFVPFNV